MLSIFDEEEGLSQYVGEHGWGLKMLSDIFEGVHLIVKLPAIILQAGKFTKNQHLHIYFSRILARFKVIIYCAFSSNHFMEECFTFQWVGGGGRVVFQIGGLHF